jgi:hypothetical protein
VLTEIEQEIAATPVTSAAALWAKIKVVMYYRAEAEGRSATTSWRRCSQIV